MKIHGTYPSDYGRWSTIVEFTEEQVIGMGFDTESYLNKGFTLMGYDYMEVDEDDLVKDGFGMAPIDKGTKALYRHDGRWLLIEFC